MQFTYDNMEDSWSLSVLKFGNVTNNQVHIFDYANCGGVIEVPDDVSYFCSKYRFRLVHYMLYILYVHFDGCGYLHCWRVSGFDSQK